jgi:uncharacterized protein (DUF983 family)
MATGVVQQILIATGRGWRKRCPHCGVGALFEGGKHLERCSACGLVYERNPGDTWFFTIIGDRIPIAIIIVLIFFGQARLPLSLAVPLMIVAGVVIVWTAPNRWGIGVSLHYLSRRFSHDPDDPTPRGGANGAD